jgi:L-lactate dehydrogenase complex protein LldE
MLGIPSPATYELSEFLLDHCGIQSWPLRGNRVGINRTVALHRACHGRILNLGDRQERLLQMVPGVRLAAFEQPDQCCGFGGAFSVGHPAVSSGIGREKLRCVLEAGVDTLVSGDMGCLMHLQGLIEADRLPLRTAHYAQVLAEALG